jgi:hypothetical protein
MLLCACVRDRTCMLLCACVRQDVRWCRRAPSLVYLPCSASALLTRSIQAAGMTYTIVLIFCGLWVLKVAAAALYMALVEPMSEEERSKYIKPRKRLTKEQIDELVRLREEALSGRSSTSDTPKSK